MPDTNDTLIGKWAVCGAGRIGRIESRKQLAWGLAWVGTGIDGHPWSSRDPRVICDGDAAALAESLGTVRGVPLSTGDSSSVRDLLFEARM